MVTTAIGAGDDNGGQGLSVQSDGKIVVAGRSHNGTDYDFALTRYNADGSLDTTFDTLSTLDGTPSFAEGGAAVVLDVDVDISDSELDALNGGLGNYDGASLTLLRNGGANAEDVFSNAGLLGVLTESGVLDYNGTTIGTVTTNSGGTLVLTFNTNATSALVDSTLQSIAYANSSDAPPATAQIDWTFDDGNTGSQGTGGALQATGSTTVAITATNDDPINTVPGAQTTAEDTALVFTGANAITVADIDATSMEVTLSVTNGTLTLATTAGLTSFSGDGTGTVVLQGTKAAVNTALDGLSYQPTGDYVGADTLNVVTSDLGGTGTGGILTDSDAVGITVTAVNDDPINSVPGAQGTPEDTAI
ncbi:MAG: hypothetical protein GY708_25830, partial [Actinomycetia bacterium]|nr:hypothetical protein [Actinomycetes bacterium]